MLRFLQTVVFRDCVHNAARLFYARCHDENDQFRDPGLKVGWRGCFWLFPMNLGLA